MTNVYMTYEKILQSILGDLRKHEHELRKFLGENFYKSSPRSERFPHIVAKHMECHPGKTEDVILLFICNWC